MVREKAMKGTNGFKSFAEVLVLAAVWYAAGVASAFLWFEWQASPSSAEDFSPSRAEIATETFSDKFDRAGVMAASALHQRSEADLPTEYRTVRVDGVRKAFVPNPYQGTAFERTEKIRRLPDMAGVRAGETIETCAKSADATLVASLVWEMSRGEAWSVGTVGGNVVASTTRRGAEALVAEGRRKGKNLNVGLLQLNTRTLARYGVSPEEALEPCVNLHIAADRLSTLYEEALRRNPAGGPAAAREAVDRFRAENHRSAPAPIAVAASETNPSSTGAEPPAAERPLSSAPSGEPKRTPTTVSAPASPGPDRGSGLIF